MKETSNGKPYKQFTLENGKVLRVFNFDAHYDSLQEGMEIDDAELVFDAKWDNYKLKAMPKPTSAPRASGAITKAMETKQLNTEKNMDRKEESIRIAGAFRDATQITLASLKDVPFPTDEEFKAEWTKWCKWLLGQSDQPFI